MFYNGVDSVYWLIFIITLVVSLSAQAFVSFSYRKWGSVKNSSGLTGAEIGEQIISRSNLGDISFKSVPGNLTDHYDPRDHSVSLSPNVSQRDSVAAAAIVAHELGHAEQHAVGSSLIKLRSALLPALKFSPQAASLLIFIGFLFNFTGLIWLGILFYAVMVVFTIVTLPVEIDASRRGLALLKKSGLLTSQQDARGARQVLTAAAMTYVAAAITAILQLLYYVSIARRRS